MSKSKQPDTMARLERMLERQDINDCMLRFSRGMDRFDRDLFLSAFHKDAVISAGDFVGSPVELYDWARQMHDHGQHATHHLLLNHNADVDGDAAHAETYYLFVGRNRDDTNWVAGGRYIDRLERRDNVWKIALRTNAIEWAGMLPTLPIPFADIADINQNGAPSRSKEDPSYRRPLTNSRRRRVPAP